MKRASDFNKILLFREATDMRKQINGLAEIVQETMNESPFSENLFLFCNRRKDILKAIYFDRKNQEATLADHFSLGFTNIVQLSRFS